MTPHILNQNEKEEILKMLNQQFGIERINGILLTNNYEKFFIYEGLFKEKEISEVQKIAPIEKIGIYFAKIEVNKEDQKKIRLSIEGSQIMKNQITKNFFELNDEQLKEWLKGNEILLNPRQWVDGKGLDGGIKSPLGFVIIKYKEDFLGTGKASESKITNFMPKARRLKK